MKRAIEQIEQAEIEALTQGLMSDAVQLMEFLAREKPIVEREDIGAIRTAIEAATIAAMQAEKLLRNQWIERKNVY